MRVLAWTGIWISLVATSVIGAWAMERYVVRALPVIEQEVVQQDNNYTEDDAAPTPSPSPEFIPPVPHPTHSPVSIPKPPSVEVRQELSEPLVRTVRAQWDASLESYVPFVGSVAYPHEIVREILEQQRLGHLEYNVSIPAMSYMISGEQIDDTRYRVDPEHISLGQDAVVPVSYILRYPTLSENQFTFLADKKDYRFVYGLIRGVVEHEEVHLALLQDYIKLVEDILRRPLVSSHEIIASSQQEFHTKASELVKNELSGRLDTAQEQHSNKQYALDNPAENPVIRFEFEEPVDGSVPPTLIAEFQGVATFSFSLLSSPPPRPYQPGS